MMSPQLPSRRIKDKIRTRVYLSARVIVKQALIWVLVRIDRYPSVRSKVARFLLPVPWFGPRLATFAQANGFKLDKHATPSSAWLLEPDPVVLADWQDLLSTTTSTDTMNKSR